MFVDTHTHIYTEEFNDDRAEVVQRAQNAGAVKLFLPNIDESSIEPMLKLCAQYPKLCYPMMGLHPTELPANPWPLLEQMEQKLHAHGNPYIAVGEVGIDLYWDKSRCNEQIAVLRHQAEWAVRFHLPLMIHARAAHRELVDTLRPLADDLTGVFHCFGGTADEAHELLSTFCGFSLGIGGVLTFKKSKLPASLHAEVPLERIVVETDAPYLAPTPHRGERNEPSYIPLILSKLSEIYCLPQTEIETQLLENTKHLFPKAFSQEC